jgi:hypothetical protein
MSQNQNINHNKTKSKQPRMQKETIRRRSKLVEF